MLDLTAYPHLLEVILEHVDTPTLRAVSQTCRALRSRFPTHVIARAEGLTTLDGQHLPSTPSTLSLLRVLDVHEGPLGLEIHSVPVLRCTYGTPDAVWAAERVFFMREHQEQEYYTPQWPMCRTVLSFRDHVNLQGELGGLYGAQLVFIFPPSPPISRWNVFNLPPPDLAGTLSIIGKALTSAALAYLAPSCTVHRGEFWATFVGLGSAEGAARKALKSGHGGDREVRNYLREHVRFLSVEEYKAEVGEVQFCLETVWSGD